MNTKSTELHGERSSQLLNHRRTAFGAFSRSRLDEAEERTQHRLREALLLPLLTEGSRTAEVCSAQTAPAALKGWVLFLFGLSLSGLLFCALGLMLLAL